MMMPKLFDGNIFNDIMDGFDSPVWNIDNPLKLNPMKTDVKETENAFEFDINLPGYKKEDISAKLKDGYLTISAETQSKNEEKDEEGKYIRKERYTGSVSRTFQVGENLTEEDIKARYADGVLYLQVPKEKKEEPHERFISIEG